MTEVRADSGPILAIDCGNTRIKWGLCVGGPGNRHAGDATSWSARGTVRAADVHRLAAEWQSLAPPGVIVISNVAGAAVHEALTSALAHFPVMPLWIVPKRNECGVANEYLDPAQLGPDRWAALIGARSLERGACLVVNAGTATTVDLLSAQGVFRGGAILPGLSMMKRSLAAGTAALPQAEGRFTETPQTTVDAIESGCLAAQVGAIERFFSVLEPRAVCLLSGGEATHIAPRLAIPTRVVENLVLEGLVRLASP